MWMNSLGVGLFTTRTVDELLWGYEDPLLVRVSSTNRDVEKVFGLMYKVCTPWKNSFERNCNMGFLMTLNVKFEHLLMA